MYLFGSIVFARSAYTSPRGYSTGASPAIKTIFYQFARLFRLPIAVMLVYDGAQRPKSKRGKKVKGTPHGLTRVVKQMGVYFGFRNHDVCASI